MRGCKSFPLKGLVTVVFDSVYEKPHSNELISTLHTRYAPGLVFAQGLTLVLACLCVAASTVLGLRSVCYAPQ